MRSLFPVALIALTVPVAAQAQFSDSYNFLKAVKERDGTKVTEFLNKPGSVIVNTRDSGTGETALHMVTAGRDSLYLGFLLQRGANPDMRDDKGNTQPEKVAFNQQGYLYNGVVNHPITGS